MDEPLLAYEHVDVAYDGVCAVHDVSFSVETGQILGIVGESGSGKSTLLKAAMGLLGGRGSVPQGRILYRGTNLLALPEKELRALCGPELAMVFQDCLAALTPSYTIGNQMYESVRVHKKCRRAEVDERACELLSRLNVEEPRRILKSYPFELSGGLGQRVGIAMAMILEPSVLLADEPTSALDAVSQKLVVEELAQLRREMGTSIVVVTHNISVVRALADSVVVLKDGSVVEEGPAACVLEEPESEYTKELLAAVPSIPWAGDEAGEDVGDGNEDEDDKEEER